MKTSKKDEVLLGMNAERSPWDTAQSLLLISEPEKTSVKTRLIGLFYQ